MNNHNTQKQARDLETTSAHPVGLSDSLGGKQTYLGLPLGEFSHTKENFVFLIPPQEKLFVVRHSESAIRRAAKALGLTLVMISRDKGYWCIRQSLTQQWIYQPRY